MFNVLLLDTRRDDKNLSRDVWYSSDVLTNPHTTGLWYFRCSGRWPVDDILSSPFWLTSGFLNAIAMDGTPVIAHLYLHIAMCHCLHAWSLFHPLNHLNPSVLGRVIPPKQAGLMQSLLPTTNPTSHIQPLSSIEPDTYSKRFFPCHHPYNYSIAIFVCYNAIYNYIYIMYIYICFLQPITLQFCFVLSSQVFSDVHMSSVQNLQALHLESPIKMLESYMKTPCYSSHIFLW